MLYNIDRYRRNTLSAKAATARLLTEQIGTGLVEAVVAVGILGGVIVMFLAALTTHSIATRSMDSNDQAINLVKTQLEDIKNAKYNTLNCYPVTVTPPSTYTVTVNTVLEPGTTNVQRVTVAASRAGTTYLSIEMLKGNLSTTDVQATTC